MKTDKSKTWARSQTQTEGSLWEICLFAVFFVVIFSAVARAEAATAVAAPAATLNSGVVVNAPKEKAWKPSAKLVIETTRTLQEDEEPSYGGSYELSLGVANKTGWSASAKVGYEREYSYERDDGTDGSMTNPSAVIAKSFKPDESAPKKSGVWNYLDFITLSASGVLPGNKEFAVNRKFQGSLGTSVKFGKSIRRLDVAQGFGYTRGFYEYDIRDDGTVNAPDQFKSSTDLSLNVTSKLALSASVALTHAVNYQGTGKTSETSAVSVDYTFNDHVATSLGVSTVRGTQLPDGESNRVRIFDPEVASAFFDLVIGI